MWVRRTAEEYNHIVAKKKLKRFNPLLPLLASFISTILMSFYGGLPVVALVFVWIILFFLAYGSQILFRNGFIWLTESQDFMFRFPKPDLICPRCHEIQTYSERCTSCAEPLESLDHWKWIKQNV